MVPKVSVCIDSFNYGRFLPEAIQSVLDQTFQDYELIIADDCSTDDSVAIARKYAERDRRVRVEIASANRGMVKNRNACLALANGEFVKWLHADDFLCSRDALARMVAALDGTAPLPSWRRPARSLMKTDGLSTHGPVSIRSVRSPAPR